MPPVTDLGDYRRQREQVTRAERLTELRETDQQNANCTHFFIIGESRHAVQGRIDYRMAEVQSFAAGFGEFTNPRRFDGLWLSFGEVFACPDWYRPDVVTEHWK